MNPNFPATPFTGSFISANTDPVARQYLGYDSWLYTERNRNWEAYVAYLQAKEKQARILQQQWVQYYEYLRQVEMLRAREQQQQHLQHLQQQQQQQQREQQKREEEAQMDRYLKEIDEQRLQQERELNLELAAEDDAEEWAKAAEMFAKSCREEELQSRRAARRERQWESRRERRAFARAVKRGMIDLNANQTPTDGEVSRADHYNADKPSRHELLVNGDKRKSQKFEARRKFGSGWAKQVA